MPSEAPPGDADFMRSMRAMLQQIRQTHGEAAYLEAAETINRLDESYVANPDAPAISHLRAVGVPMHVAHHGAPKWVVGHEMLRAHPEKWFGNTPIGDRDLALINASPVSWITIGQRSFLKHVHHKLHGQDFETTMWTVENDETLRGMLSEVGAGFTGFADFCPQLPARNWEHMMVNVNICGNIAPGVTWGLLSGRPSTARVLAGPCETCDKHPWDVMILRDFHTNTSGLDDVAHIASRQFDILLMKMCEDFDHPWVVVAVKDSGPLEMRAPCCSSDGHCDNSCLGV